MAIASVDHDENWLQVSFDDGSTERFLGSWLRDNIVSGRHQDAGQRTFDINLMPKLTISDATHASDGVAVSFEPEGLSETFPDQWLQDRCGSSAAVASPTLWGHEMQDRLEFADLEELTADPTLLQEWLVSLRDFGFGLVENVATVPGSILDVVALFGYVRETNYGEIFDVRVESNPANLAFTSAQIGMHTDNPYRDPAPGLQLLHCLVNESDGGENQLCDGFAVANQIRSQHPEAFELLTSHPVRFRFVEQGSVDLETSVPLIELDVDGQVRSVRYNCRSAQAFDMSSHVLADYYDAYRVLGEALHEPAARVDFRLEPGQLMVFDNQRILHGRSGFGEGKRHLQGCYADKDSLQSRIRVLESS